jgi:hypothetical protein
MFYTIYKITNQINGKFYIGSHKTKNLNDGYMGSGKYLKYAKEKYGITNFTKEILFIFDTPEQMYAKESEIVNEEFLATENTYNLKVGGFGGFDYINANPEKYLTEKRLSALMPQSERLRRYKEKLDNDPKFREEQAGRMKIAREKWSRKYPQGVWLGRKHSKETLAKLKNSAKGKGLGEKNSQFGTMWITDGIKNKKIKKDKLVPEGWKLGRVLKS